jgi:hypothetical protein
MLHACFTPIALCFVYTLWRFYAFLTRDWESPKALPGTLPERGIITKGLLHHHASLRSDA